MTQSGGANNTFFSGSGRAGVGGGGGRGVLMPHSRSFF